MNTNGVMTRRILIVDDEDYITEMLSLLVFSLEFEPITAVNGLEALKLANAERFDLIITDMKMPVMDGRQFVSEIVKLDAYQGVPIIIFSGYSSVYDVQDLMEKGVKEFVSKPIEIAELKEIILKNMA